MGLGGISPWSLLLILVIVLLLFGTKKLRNLGGDLGGAFKGFKNAMSDEDKSNEEAPEKDKAIKSDDNATAQQAEAASEKDESKTK